MAQLTPELEAALAPVANNTAELLAIARELKRRAEINRNFNFQQFANQLSQQANIADQRLTQLQAYLATANPDDEFTSDFEALRSLATNIKRDILGMQRIATSVVDRLGLNNAPSP